MSNRGCSEVALLCEIQHTLLMHPATSSTGLNSAHLSALTTSAALKNDITQLHKYALRISARALFHCSAVLGMTVYWRLILQFITAFFLLREDL